MRYTTARAAWGFAFGATAVLIQSALVDEETSITSPAYARAVGTSLQQGMLLKSCVACAVCANLLAMHSISRDTVLILLVLPCACASAAYLHLVDTRKSSARQIQWALALGNFALLIKRTFTHLNGQVDGDRSDMRTVYRPTARMLTFDCARTVTQMLMVCGTLGCAIEHVAGARPAHAALVSYSRFKVTIVHPSDMSSGIQRRCWRERKN